VSLNNYGGRTAVEPEERWDMMNGMIDVSFVMGSLLVVFLLFSWTTKAFTPKRAVILARPENLRRKKAG